MSHYVGWHDDWKYDVPNMYSCSWCDEDPDEDYHSMMEAVVAWGKVLAESFERQHAALMEADLYEREHAADTDSS